MSANAREGLVRRTLRRVAAFDAWDAVAAILLWKLGTFATAYVARSLLAFNHDLYTTNYRYGERNPSSFLDGFNTWDSQHYIRIAELGYREGLLSNAFGPLYPLLMRAGSWLTGDSIVSGLVVANVASGLALYLLYRLVCRRWDREVAFAAVLLCMAFPTAFYLNLIYTEALFLLLLVGLFYALYEGRWWLAAWAGFFLPVLRVPGLVALLPMLWFLAPLRVSWREWRPRVQWGPWRPRALFALAPVAGFAAYLVYMHLAVGNVFVAMDAEKQFISHRGLDNLLRPDRLVNDFFLASYSVHGYLDSAIDRIFFAVFVLSLPVVYRRVDTPMFLLCAVIGLQPFLGSFMSYARLVMVAFPLYIAWAATFAGWRPRLTYAVAYPMLLLQAVFLAMQVNSYWVA